MDISIYQSPEITLPVTFSFPDETMQVGNALLLPPVGLPEELTGAVFFQGVDEGKPVEGQFNFTSGRGGHFKGKFKAAWEHKPVYCG